MELLIGLPVFKREWILPDWFKYIEEQSYPLNKIGFVFLTAPEEQDPLTIETLFEWQQSHPEVQTFEIIIDQKEKHRHHMDGTRIWPAKEYIKMSNFRNTLLDYVKVLNPKYYFSLDSDILLTNPDTINGLIQELKNYDAVSPLCYMYPSGIEYPNVMSYRDIDKNRVYRRPRYPIGTTFESDVIMAAVMMSKKAYSNSLYSPHKSGEDIGWCQSINKWGGSMACVSELYATHIMHKKVPTKKYEILKDAPGIYENFKINGDRRNVSLVNK